VLPQERLFPKPVLGGVQDFSARPHRRLFGGGSGGCGRNVLEFERDRSNIAGELPDRVKIIVGRVDFEVRNLAGWRIGIGRQRVDAITHPACGDGEHPAQLPAAENPDGRSR